MCLAEQKSNLSADSSHEELKYTCAGVLLLCVLCGEDCIVRISMCMTEGSF